VCHCIYGCMFCVLLFNFVYYVLLLLGLCILTFMYVLFGVLCFIVSFCVLFVCKCVLYCCHRGVNPIAVIKRIISYHIISYHIYHITSYHIIYHIISYRIISYHISYHITSHHIISYHIISFCVKSPPPLPAPLTIFCSKATSDNINVCSDTRHQARNPVTLDVHYAYINKTLFPPRRILCRLPRNTQDVLWHSEC
jgi:hypothetical protein